MMSTYTIDATRVRDIAPDVLDENGRLKIMPASYYAGTTVSERAVFCVRNGVYSLPTTELIDWLRAAIDGRPAIEIGAGNGVIAEALGIPATDNRMQEAPAMAALYNDAGQAPVTYGANVEKIAAREAVRKYRPDVVVGAWVTHKYDARRHEHGGNMFGVDETDVLKHCQHYLFVGNVQVHKGKEIWRKPNTIDYPNWLYSRAMNSTPDFVAAWRGSKR